MPKFSGLLGRVISALVVVALIQFVVPAPAFSWGGGGDDDDGGHHGGRDKARCVIICKVVQIICSIRCFIACYKLHPNDSSARWACVNDCRDVCLSEEDECKMRCDGVEPPDSPEEP